MVISCPLRRCLGTAAAVIAAGFGLASPAAPGEKRPFTVVDSIEMRRLVSVGGETRSSDFVVYSPSGAHFLVRTQKGNLARDVVQDELFVFRTGDVERYLGMQATPPPLPRRLVRQEAPAGSKQLFSISWLDDSTVGFIANAADERRQAFSVDINTGSTRQLTRSSADVAEFATGGGSVVYWARADKPTSGARVGHDEWLGSLLEPQRDGAFRYPIVDLHTVTAAGSHRRFEAPAAKIRSHFHRIWVSPSGRHAVTFAPATNAPRHWLEYKVYRPDIDAFTPEVVSSDPTSLQFQLRLRYQLIDLHDGRVRPLFDAPTGFLSFNYTPAEVFWPRGRNTLIVTNTFLPLLDAGSQQRAERAAAPAIAEVDLESGKISVIAWEPTRAGEKDPFKRQRIIAVNWDAERQALSVTTRAVSGDERLDTYLRRGDGWTRAKSPGSEEQSGIRVFKHEALNVRPVLAAEGGACSCDRILLDPAPEAERFDFARTELHRWATRDGTQWKGGLVFPRGYQSGKRYPLVVQTHGFDAEEFLIDGPHGYTTAMAAQALASAGFLVLQIEDNVAALPAAREGAIRYAEGYKVAIEDLISRGQADASRVGIIAFSITGLPTLHLVGTEPQLVKAVIMADANSASYMTHIVAVNAVPEYGSMLKRTLGFSSTKPKPTEWFEKSFIYNLKHAGTPFRIEALHPDSAASMWELYALLRHADQPADFIYQPDALHILFRPGQRLVSQGGAVDWFRFWLQDYEDPDAAKAAQYERWRELRATAKAASVHAPAAAIGISSMGSRTE
jgi:predicted dienelactone hydrolase